MIPRSQTARHLVTGLALAWSILSSAHGQVQLIHPLTKVWKYSADNSDQYAAGFPDVSDVTWPEGLALFGADSNGNYPYAFNTFVGSPAVGVQTSYYRTRFQWAGPTAGLTLWMTNMVDDGIVIYLNGTEILRWNINAPAFTPVTHETMAASANPGGEPVIARHLVTLDSLTNGAPNPLLSGENLLSVSVHQAGAASSDTVFGLSAYVGQVPTPCIRTVVPPSTNVFACRSVTFRADFVPDISFFAAALQWYRNVGQGEEPLPGQTGTNLTLMNVSTADSGSYYLRTTSAGGTCESAHATLLVLPDKTGPAILWAEKVPPAQIRITFDEPYLPVAAGGVADEVFTWSITEAGEPVRVVSASGEPDNPSQVRLTLERDIFGGIYTYTTLEPIADNCQGAETAAGQTGSILEPVYVLHWTDLRDWRFNQSGADQGDAWRHPGFDDSSWDFGPQGFGLANPAFPDAPGSLRTPLTVSTQQITYYFRTTFRSLPLLPQAHRLFVAVDDGAVIYVNGVEIGRINMPSGPVTVGTLAFPAPLNQDYQPVNGLEIPAHLLGGGNNLLAIEVHQATATSSDVLMLAKITTPYLPPPLEPPEILTHPRSVSVVDGRSFTLSAVAASNSWIDFQWQKDGVPIPGATSASYTSVAQESSAGVYRLEASNPAGIATSDPATVNVRQRVVRYDAPWKYETQNLDATLSGTPWHSPAFNDAAWRAGPGLLGYETTTATLARVPTLLTVLDLPTAENPTIYFRSTVTVPAISPGESFFLSHFIDEGAAFYVDGQLAFVYNMSGGPSFFATPAAGVLPGDADAREITAPIALSAGTHTLAAEVHQAASANRDVLFGVEITRGPALPALHIAHASPGTVTLRWTPTPSVRLFVAPSADGMFSPVFGDPPGEFTFTLPATKAGTQAWFFRLGF